MKNILIIGSTGQIGSELTMALRQRYGDSHVVAGYIEGAEPHGILRDSGPMAMADVTDGEMIAEVTFEKTTYAPLPLKFEAGTQNFVAAACMAPALETARALAEDAALEANLAAMRDYLLAELLKIEGLRIYGTPRDVAHKIPLFSFTVAGAYASDLAQILDKMGIAVRSGHMCAEPLLRRYGQTSMLRASLAPYNTLPECEAFVAALRRAVNMLR